MEYRKVTAIVRAMALDDIEQSLTVAGVKGVTVTRVKGYGEYRDFFTRDGMTEHVRLEIFAHRDRVDRIVDTICRVASTGSEGDGIIAVLPVEHVYRIRDHTAANPDDSGEL